MNKNSIRLLVAVGLIVLVVCSWYTLINDTQKANNAYMAQINTARDKAQQGLYQVALEHYAEAMEQRDSIELRDEIAQVYEDNAGSSAYESFCEDIVADFPMEIKGYERLVAFYRDTKAYDTCFNIMETAQKRGLKSDLLDSIKVELAYTYDLERSSAIAVSSYSSGYFPVQYKSGYWGFVNYLGSSVTSGAYVKVAPFTSSGLGVALLQNGRVALIDATGKQNSLSPEGVTIEDCTPLLSGKLAIKYEGKYHYCDSSFKELFGAYDYAGSFYGGVAAVMEGSKWAIIDETGNKVTDFVFEDIKLDDKGIAFRNDRAIAKRDGNYILIDSKGNQVGSGSWQDADAFNSDMLAAVMKDGKWGFIDSTGKVVVEYTYDGAKSFSSGMAAVAVDDKWGYISSEDYQIKIEPDFAEANDFSPNGTAFVKEGEKYRLLRIYRLT